MEPTLRPPSMRPDDDFPAFGFFLILAILIAIGVAIPFHSTLKKWFRKCFSRNSSCLRICECGSEEGNERGADAQEQIEMNDLVYDQLDIHPQQNRDNLRPNRGRQQLPFDLGDLENNQIEFRPEGGNLGVNELPEILVEMRNVQNLPNGDIRRNQHSL